MAKAINDQIDDQFPMRHRPQTHILQSDRGVKESDMIEVLPSSSNKLQKKMDIC